MVVGNFARGEGAVGGFAYFYEDAAFFEVDTGGAGADKFRAVQTGAEWGADVAGFEAASGDLGEHGSEEQGVGFAD